MAMTQLSLSTLKAISMGATSPETSMNSMTLPPRIVGAIAATAKKETTQVAIETMSLARSDLLPI